MKKRIAFVIVFMLLLGIPQRAGAEALSDTAEGKEISSIVSGIKKEAGEDILSDTDYLIPGDSVSDWTALALTLSGEGPDPESYLKGLEEYVENEYKEKGFLSDTRATDYHRIALTVKVLGGDPTAFSKDNNGDPVDLIKAGTYGFTGGSPSSQGANGLIYAIIVLDSVDYEIPEEYGNILDSYIDELLLYQGENGGFIMAGGLGENEDITAMALQALAPHRDRTDVAEAVDRALGFLSERQQDDGGYTGEGDTGNAETAAQVIMALCALGMDPSEEDIFIKNGVSLVDNLLSFKTEDGTYRHTLSDEKMDIMATEHALRAFESIRSMKETGTSIYDLKDYEGPLGNGSHKGFPLMPVVIGISVAAAAAAIFIILKKVKRN